MEYPLCTYRRELYIRALRGRPIWLAFAITLTVLLGTKLLIAAVDGTLLSSTFTEAAKADMDNIWSVLSRAPKPIREPPTGTEFPYLRDYVDVLLMLLGAAHMAVFVRQWHNISIAVPGLWNDGVLNRRVLAPSDYARLLARYDRRYNSLPAAIGCFVLAVTAVILGVWAFSHWGMYHLLIPAGTADSWQEQAYQGWWANPGQHPFAAFWNILIYVFGLYHLLKTNWIGIVTIQMVLEIRGASRNARARPVLDLKPWHGDEEGGTRIFRLIMQDILISVLLTAVCASLVLGCYLPDTAVGNPILLGVVAFLFVTLGPAYVFIPYSVIGAEMMASKRRLLRIATSRIRDLSRRQNFLDSILGVLRSPNAKPLAYWSWLHSSALRLPDRPIQLSALALPALLYAAAAIPVIQLIIDYFSM